MATRIIAGIIREVWQEATPLNGGASRTITTGIAIRTASLPRLSAALYVTAVAGSPQIAATVASVNGFAAVTISNGAAAGNTAVYVLDIVRLQSSQQAPCYTAGGIVHVVGGVVASPSAPELPGYALATTDVNVASYPVVEADVVLFVRRTSTGACEIVLPAISAVRAGRIIAVKDSGNNAATYNITVRPDGSDKIDTVAAPFVIDIDGAAFWLHANSVALNWEIV